MKKFKLKKKFIFGLLFSVAIFTVIIVLLNIKVTSRQGVNYQWHTFRIPLYLKILDFFDRHYNYKELTKKIVNDAKAEKEQVMRIFKWTYHNIREITKGLPAIDDHVWHIIVRGYGTSDQSSDVFCTLCNYAGIKAFFLWISTQEQTQRIPLSMVKIEGRWIVFDPYNGAYFEINGRFADINELKRDKWRVTYIGKPRKKILDYKRFFFNIRDDIEKTDLKRSQIQSPLRRLIFQIRKWID